MVQSSPSFKRIAELDWLRGIAILLVLGRHLLSVPVQGDGAVGAFFRAWKNCGWIGVDLFFVLSGYLVGGLLLREGIETSDIRPGTFLARRGFRIYPAFYVLLLGSYLIKIFVGLRFPLWPQGLWHETFFVQNYLPGLWPQTWSLAVEEHFYLLLLALMVGLRRHDRARIDPFRSLPWIVFGINTAVLFGRLIAGYGFQVHWSVLALQTQWRLDSLLFGVLLFYAVEAQPTRSAALWLRLRPWRWIGLPILLLPSMVLDIQYDRYVVTLGPTAVYLGFGWILFDLLERTPNGTSRARASLQWLQAIGRSSYSIYLWHFAVYYVLGAYLHRKLMLQVPLWVEGFGMVAVAIATGIMMTLVVEKPFLRWRERWVPARIHARSPAPVLKVS